MCENTELTSHQCLRDIREYDPNEYHMETLLHFDFDAWEAKIRRLLQIPQTLICYQEVDPQSAIILICLQLENKNADNIHKGILRRLLCFALLSYREFHEQHYQAGVLAHMMPSNIIKNTTINRTELETKISVLLDAGVRYKLIAQVLGFGSLFLLGNSVARKIWEGWLPLEGPHFEIVMEHLKEKDTIPMGKLYEKIAERINSSIQNLVPNSRSILSPKRKSDHHLNGTNKRNKNLTTMNFVYDKGDGVKAQPNAADFPNHIANFADQIHYPVIDQFQDEAAVTLPASSISCVLKTKLNGEDYSVESTLEKQWPSTKDTCSSISGIDSNPFQLSKGISDNRESVIFGPIYSMKHNIDERQTYDAKEGKYPEMDKLKYYLGTRLLEGIDESRIRKKEKAGSILRFSKTVSLFVPIIEGKDFTLKVTLSKSFGKTVLQVINVAQDLHKLLGAFIFKAMNDSKTMFQAKREGIPGFKSAVTVSFEDDDHHESDCEVAITLNYLLAYEIFVHVFMSS
ncbi:hypothetical protein sscle_04g037460 [Sclerotinia sclerotiorum 1980 UF-70]|uniref:Uncharacterized protein n=1 Tax=Sclerotinia sclerotiorum (strain ATCC 18683 / 1980 / Ss-1) TaxID=665079 RepID=A0A1D9Q257_SCLS1|nr:hypothetical protein sscle_04g037460 [Sclerotinia sclerotiorum 1980 UF-70]